MRILTSASVSLPGPDRDTTEKDVLARQISVGFIPRLKSWAFSLILCNDEANWPANVESVAEIAKSWSMRRLQGVVMTGA